MAYPYPHRHRPQGDQIEIHKLGSTSITTAQTFTQDINLPYNSWLIGAAVWAESNDHTITIKANAYVDHDQNIEGGSMFLVQHGSTDISTSLTIAATPTGSGGFICRIYPSSVDGGESAGTDGYYIGAHGFKITASITGAAASGTMDWEIIAVPQV